MTTTQDAVKTLYLGPCSKPSSLETETQATDSSGRKRRLDQPCSKQQISNKKIEGAKKERKKKKILRIERKKFILKRKKEAKRNRKRKEKKKKKKKKEKKRIRILTVAYFPTRKQQHERTVKEAESCRRPPHFCNDKDYNSWEERKSWCTDLSLPPNLSRKSSV